MRRPLRLWSRSLHGGVFGLLAAAVAVAGPFRPDQPAAAQPAPARAAGPRPTELQYVPADAAFFLHADAAGIWTSDLAKSFRAADKAPFVKLEDAAAAFGVKIDDLKSVVLFIPKLKVSDEGVQLRRRPHLCEAVRQEEVGSGDEGGPTEEREGQSARRRQAALVLVGLGEEYGKPQPADADGPLTAALQTAATGQHALVAAATLANLPDELQRDDLPGELRAFQPILKAQSITATVGLGKSLDLSVSVKTKREAQAVDAEKALAAFVTLATDELGRDLKDLEEDAMKDMGLKDLVKVLKTTLAAAKGAKFAVDGTEARLTASLPLAGLPLASAYVAATTKVSATCPPPSRRTT